MVSMILVSKFKLYVKMRNMNRCFEVPKIIQTVGIVVYDDKNFIQKMQFRDAYKDL